MEFRSQGNGRPLLRRVDLGTIRVFHSPSPNPASGTYWRIGAAVKFHDPTGSQTIRQRAHDVTGDAGRLCSPLLAAGRLQNGHAARLP